MGERIDVSTNKYYVFKPFTRNILSNFSSKIDNTFNRDVNLDRVNSITKYIQDEFHASKHIHTFGVIILCEMKNKFYVIDGQHRLFSYLKCIDMGIEDSNVKVSFEVIKVKTADEIKNLFMVNNIGIPVPEYNFGDNKQTISYIKQIISEKWPSCISTSQFHQIHTINLDLFCTFLHQYQLIPNLYSREECVRKVVEWNDKCKIALNLIKSRSKSKCLDKEFFLGIYRGNEELAHKYFK